MRLSAEASAYLRQLAILFVKDGFNLHRTFDGGRNSPVHAELQAAGLITKHGTSQAPWSFTEAFKDWVMENRPDLDP